MKNAKPVIELCHVLLNVIDGETRYFGCPIDYSCLPELASLVTLATDEENWIELYPVEECDTEILRAFQESESEYYEIVLDDNHSLPTWVSISPEGCRWFADLKEQ